MPDEPATDLPAPDAGEPIVADEPDPAFGETDDDSVETPEPGEPPADAPEGQ